MGQTLQELQQKAAVNRNWWDSTLGFFGGGIDNPNYVPSVDPNTGKVAPASWWEKFRGISDEEKTHKYEQQRQQDLKRTPSFGYLDSIGKAPELTTSTNRAKLLGLATEQKDIKALTAELLTHRGSERLAKFKADGVEVTSDLLRGAIQEQIKQNHDTNPDTILKRETASLANTLAQQSQSFQQNMYAENQRSRWEDRREQREQNALNLAEGAANRAAMMKIKLAEIDADNANRQADREYRKELDFREKQMNLVAALSNLTAAFVL